MKNCSTCNAEIASNAKTCPSCGAKNKKPIYKRWWFILILVVLVLSALGGTGGEDAETPELQSVASRQPAEELASGEDATEPSAEELASDEDTAEPTVAEPEKPVNTVPEMTMGQKNALKSAQQYLDYSAFSYEGLVKQLEYEGYSNADAVYAVDRCGADWNEQAALSAESYLEYSSFSRQGLIDQLVYEGFTAEQAAYGATAAGY
ncbi:hypothetical protein GXN74_12120 [Clostridiales bacterium F-3ap]|uniref:Putative host cell surface-exposed lipoprotein Ltp-like HTH region domain-containing protein n=2 Tax=Anaerotalea alkaliphila TaxID=2662126 RepID=A0A7X5HXK1_9FIRM|nr:hypothetical protein [Anaerotalea alkaliphila]